MDFDRVELDVLLFGEHVVVRGEASLRLGLTRLRTGAHPLELFRERALTCRALLLLECETCLLLFEPAGVVALKREAAAAVNLEDPARDVVEEVAIMGDRDDAALVVVQKAFEPGDRLGVEMVGRLVEQEQVGRREQQATECDATLLATGEVRDGCIARRQA